MNASKEYEKRIFALLQAFLYAEKRQQIWGQDLYFCRFLLFFSSKYDIFYWGYNYRLNLLQHAKDILEENELKKNV